MSNVLPIENWLKISCRLIVKCTTPHQGRRVNSSIGITENCAEHKTLSLQIHEGLPEEPCAMRVARTVHKVDIPAQFAKTVVNPRRCSTNFVSPHLYMRF